MAFDWLRFLTNHGIEYVTTGSSVVRGNVAVHCPWCRYEDPSYHLGISLHGKGWGCWRNRTHRGISPVRLICALAGCSPVDALRMIESGVAPAVSTDRLTSMLQRLKPVQSDELPSAGLQFPPSIKPLVNTGLGRRFFNYVERRGYSPAEVSDIIDKYGLRYSIDGYFTYRVIFPVYGVKNVLSWTGRSIDDRASVRYLTLSPDEEKMRKVDMPPASCSIKEIVWNLPDLFDGDYKQLIVVEGPFDALRVDYYGRRCGIRATCLFGTGITEDQIEWLRSLRAERPDVRYGILFDDGTDMYVRTLVLSELFGFSMMSLPSSAKDPALLTKTQVEDLTVN